MSDFSYERLTLYKTLYFRTFDRVCHKFEGLQ